MRYVLDANAQKDVELPFPAPRLTVLASADVTVWVTANDVQTLLVGPAAGLVVDDVQVDPAVTELRVEVGPNPVVVYVTLEQPRGGVR